MWYWPLLFSKWRFLVPGLLFYATGTPPWLLRPVKASTSSELYLGYFWLLTFARPFCHLFVSFYCMRYSFEWNFFTHKHCLPCTPSKHFSTFVPQMQVGTPKPRSSSILVVIELSLPARAWPWTTTDVVVAGSLFYQLHYQATKYRVKAYLLYVLDSLMLV